MTSDPSSIPSPDSNDSKRCVVNQSLLHKLPEQSSSFQANREAGGRPSKRKINIDTQSMQYSIASDERRVSLMQQQPLEAPDPAITTKTNSPTPSEPSSSDMASASKSPTSNGNPTMVMDPQKVLLAYNPGESSAPLYLDHKFPLQQQSPVAAASTVPVASTGQKPPVAATTANSAITNGAGKPNTVAQSYSLMDIHTVSMWTEYGVFVPLTTTTVTTTTTTMTTTSALPTSSTGSPVTPTTPNHTALSTATGTKKPIVEQHTMTSGGLVSTMLTMDPHMIYLMRVDAYQKTATTTTSTIATKLLYQGRPATSSQRPANTTITNDRKHLKLVTTKTTTTTTTTQTDNIIYNNRRMAGMGNNAVEMYSRYGIPIIPPTTAAVTAPIPPSSSSSRRLQSAVTAGEEPSVDEKKSSEADIPNNGRLPSTPTRDRSSSSNNNGSNKKQSEFERIAAEAKAFRLAEQERIAREKQEELEAQQLAKQQEQERVAQQGNQFRISEEQRILQEKKDMQQRSVLLKQNEIKQVGQQNVEFRTSEEARIAEEKKKRLMKNGNEELDSLATNAIVTEEQAKWNKEVEEHERRRQEKIEEEEARKERLKAEEVEKENTRSARLQQEKREEEERIKAEEAARIAAEEKRVQDEKEAARIAEEQREAEVKAAEDARLANEKAAAEEAASLKAEKEAQRIAEEKRKAEVRAAEEAQIAIEKAAAEEAARLDAENEANRIAEEKRLAEEARIEKEKAARLEAAEAARIAEEQRLAKEKAALEKEKAAEAARLKAEEAARIAEENRLAKEKAAEAAKLEKQKAVEAARLKAEEEARIANEDRLAKEQAAEKARMAEEKRLADAARVVEEQAAEAAKRKIQEDARIEEAKRAAAEAQIAEEKRLAREVAAAEARRQAEVVEHERKLAEKRKEQARRDAERLETLKQREFEASRLRLEAAKKRKAEQIAAENARRLELEAKTNAAPPKAYPGQTAKVKQPDPPASGTYHDDGSTKLVMLTSSSSGNRLQAGNQKRALSLLRAHGIEPEVIDGSDPKNIDVRNQYVGISGIRGNYPQFFAITDLEATFIGNVETLEFMNDAGTLSRKSILSSISANHGAAEKQKKKVAENVEVQLQHQQSKKTTAGAKNENNEGKKTLSVVSSQVRDEATVDVKKKMNEERSTPSEVSQAEGRKEKSSNRERGGNLSAAKKDGDKLKEHHKTRTVKKPKESETAGHSSAGHMSTSDLHAVAGGNDRFIGIPALTVDNSNQAESDTDVLTTTKKNSKKKASSSTRKKPQKSKASKKGKPKGKSRGVPSLDFPDDFDFDKELPKRRFGGFKIGATEVAVGVVAVSAILGYWFRSSG